MSQPGAGDRGAAPGTRKLTGVWPGEGGQQGKGRQDGEKEA